MRRGRRFLLDLVEVVGPFLFKTLMTTLRWRLIDVYKVRKIGREHGPVIWAFWHYTQAFVGYAGRNRGARVLISVHQDGEFVARLLKGIGYDAVRGSTTRGGTQALMELAGTESAQDLAITPDGPKGPPEHVHPGIIMLAQVTGRPIMPIGAAVKPCRRLHGWDRFMVPYPFSKVLGVIGDPLLVPADTNAEGRERYRRHLEETLKKLTRRAEAAAWRSVAGATRHLGAPLHRRGFG